MNTEQIEQTVMKALARIAPEVDAGTMDPDKTFRDQFDFDSMDFLTLMLDLDKELGIHISEIDYPKLSSLSGCIQYLDAKLNAVAGKS